jgi:hypothetical protein
MPRYLDTSLLQAALVGYETDLARLNTTIADLQKRLGLRRRNSTVEPVTKSPAQKKHGISAEGRTRIAAAQRKRSAAAKRSK